MVHENGQLLAPESPSGDPAQCRFVLHGQHWWLDPPLQGDTIYSQFTDEGSGGTERMGYCPKATQVEVDGQESNSGNLAPGLVGPVDHLPPRLRRRN